MMNAGDAFDAWVDEFAASLVRLNPQQATTTQYFSGEEQRILDGRLALSDPWGGFYGSAAARELAALARKGSVELARFDSRLDETQRDSAAALDWHFRNTIANADFASHHFVFSQMVGFHVMTIGFLASGHPVRNGTDVENYLARLDRFATALDEGIAQARAAAGDGILPPSFIIERVMEQLDALTSGPPADHVLVTTLVQRMYAAGDISDAAGRGFAARAANTVGQLIIPALGRVRAMLAEQLPRATSAAGAWNLPNGLAYYARALASATGTSLSAAEIHAIGLREVERIEAELERVLPAAGHANGTIPDRLAALNESVRFAPEPDPRPEILRHVQELMDDAASRAGRMFSLLPKAPVEIRREPAFSENSAAAHYTVPAPDGSIPGIYWIPLANLDPDVPWIGIGLKSTAYHEAIPGHHFQFAIEQESPKLPYFRKRNVLGYNPAFNEGWALYAEHLCAEDGWYDGDSAGYAGYLQQQLFRARRLVVDTGIHAMRWTREQAIAYGFTAAEIERYASWPGQACAYTIGYLKILDLRERAKRTLGNRFDLKAFHDVLLSGGTLPLDVVAHRVDRWSASVGSIANSSTERAH